MSHDRDLYYVARVFSLIIFAIMVAALLWLLGTEWYNASLRQFIVDHFPATIGIPAAYVFSFLIVAIFESTAGKVKFEVLALKFEGAAGPIVMWVLCFLAIASSIRFLWAIK